MVISLGHRLPPWRGIRAVGVFTSLLRPAYFSGAKRHDAIACGAPFDNFAHVRVPDIQGVADGRLVLGVVIVRRGAAPETFRVTQANFDDVREARQARSIRCPAFFADRG